MLHLCGCTCLAAFYNKKKTGQKVLSEKFEYGVRMRTRQIGM